MERHSSHVAPVAAWQPLLSPQECVDRTKPGATTDLPTFLSRPMMGRTTARVKPGNEKHLVTKLLNMVSIKGEDLLLSSTTEDNLRYHRLRASIPSNLWRWRTVTVWNWKAITLMCLSYEQFSVL